MDKIKTYYLNLDRDSKRGKNVHKLLSKLGLNPERFKAYLFKDLPDDIDLIQTGTKGELATFYSHREAWKSALNLGYEYVMVFEDDITTYVSKDHLQHILSQTLSKLKFDILYLGKCLDTCNKLEHIFGQIYKTHRPHCIHAYILSLSGMEYLIKHPQTHGAVDIHIRNLISSGELDAYVFHPSIFNQDVIRFSSNLRDKLSSLNNIYECQDLSNKKDTDNITNVVVLGIVIAVLMAIIIWLIWRSWLREPRR